MGFWRKAGRAVNPYLGVKNAMEAYDMWDQLANDPNYFDDWKPQPKQYTAEEQEVKDQLDILMRQEYERMFGNK